MQAREFVAPLEAFASGSAGQAGGAIVETTVDQTLMRGSKPDDR
jgi:hypothetical protein